MDTTGPSQTDPYEMVMLVAGFAGLDKDDPPLSVQNPFSNRPPLILEEDSPKPAH